MIQRGQEQRKGEKDPQSLKIKCAFCPVAVLSTSLQHTLKREHGKTLVSQGPTEDPFQFHMVLMFGWEEVRGSN